MEARKVGHPGQDSRFAAYRAWLAQRWAEWRRINDIAPDEALTYAHYQAFDAWLALCSARAATHAVPQHVAFEQTPAG